MNLVRRAVKDAAIGVGIADDLRELNVFLQPGCAAAIWRRQMPPEVQAWLDRLEPEALPRGRITLRVDEIAETLQQLFDLAGLPDGSEREWLANDIVRQAEIVSDLMGTRFLRLRLDVVTNNACRKFHIDAVTARLVCTYRGTGTQYGVSTDGEEPRQVFTVQTGSPILLRGTLWPGEPPSGLLHRSPPIEGTGETRLVLVIDLVTYPEEAI